MRAWMDEMRGIFTWTVAQIHNVWFKQMPLRSAGCCPLSIHNTDTLHKHFMHTVCLLRLCSQHNKYNNSRQSQNRYHFISEAHLKCKCESFGIEISTFHISSSILPWKLCRLLRLHTVRHSATICHTHTLSSGGVHDLCMHMYAYVPIAPMCTSVCNSGESFVSSHFLARGSNSGATTSLLTSL